MINEERKSSFESIYYSYMSLISKDPSSYCRTGFRMRLPIIQKHTLSEIICCAKEIWKNENSVLDLSDPIVIIGDLHGHIIDLFRIFHVFPDPKETKYLFLGDIVDRGEFSLETLTLIMILKILFPNNVYIIRGNHEFAEICESFGFLNEIMTQYGDIKLFNEFTDAFSFLPLAAQIGPNILCIHGGIGPFISDIQTIASVTRPCYSFEDHPVLDSLVWSDPTDVSGGYSESQRGYGYLFGEASFVDFLSRSSIKIVIRGHQCVDEGYSHMFNNRLITLFSASNYCGKSHNKAAVISIKDNSLSFITFGPLQHPLRSSAIFYSPSFSTNSILLESPSKQTLPSLDSKKYNSAQSLIDKTNASIMKKSFNSSVMINRGNISQRTLSRFKK